MFLLRLEVLFCYLKLNESCTVKHIYINSNLNKSLLPLNRLIEP